jgi:hypothetical protein
MSDHDFPVIVEKENVRARAVMKVGAIGLAVLAVSLLAPIALSKLSGHDVRARALPAGASPEPAPSTIGGIEQSLVDQHERGAALRAAGAARLERAAWIDAGVAEIPIERAIDVVVLRHGDGGVPR